MTFALFCLVFFSIFTLDSYFVLIKLWLLNEISTANTLQIKRWIYLYAEFIYMHRRGVTTTFSSFICLVSVWKSLLKVWVSIWISIIVKIHTLTSNTFQRIQKSCEKNNFLSQFNFKNLKQNKVISIIKSSKKG